MEARTQSSFAKSQYQPVAKLPERGVGVLSGSPLVEVIHEQSLQRHGVPEARTLGDTLPDAMPDQLSCLLLVLNGSAQDDAAILRCVALQRRTHVRVICLYESDLALALRTTHQLNIFIFLKASAPVEVITSSVVLARYLDALSSSTSSDGTGTAHTTDGASGLTAALTARQRDVLRLLAKGYSNKAIAKQLVLSEPTVKMHLSALRRVFQATNRTEILVKALRLGLHGF